MNKTNRAAALAFTICLVSSLAFADSPTDAPLMPDDGNTTVVQQQNCQDRAKSEPHDKKKKLLSSTPKRESEHTSQNNREAYESNPEYPASVNK
jgi:hypothetical protein